MITLSNVSGELKSSIGSLVQFYSKQKKSYSFFLNKGVFGTNLANLLGETHVIAPENKCCCSGSFDCCDCGGNNCGCDYCFSCNACEECLSGENNLSEKLGIQKKDGSLDIPVTYEQWLESERVNKSFFERRVDNRDFCGIYKV
jgi:hypothetical protein